MSEATLASSEDGQFRLSGALNFTTVAPLSEQIFGLIDQGDATKIDLSGVEHSNSAGVALLVESTRYAQAQNKSIQFVNMPEKMLAIVKLSGLEGILPLQ